MVAVVALIHREKGAYGISFPDFQGCVSGGETLDETLRRGRETLAFHIECMLDAGEDLPMVRDLDAIKADPTFEDDFADAAIVSAVDVDLPARSVRVNISLDQRLLERIDRRARDIGESRYGFLAGAARARLGV